MTSSKQDPAFLDNKIIISIAALIVSLITIVIYLPALQNGFVNWDDQLYIYDNQHIQSISTEFFKWIFTTFHASNWHPLTWLSHAIDYAFWGLDPMGHHLTSIIFHGLNTFLVVLLITRLIQIARRRKEGDGLNVPLTTAVVTGLLFGLHPLHVESVAWVSERKDLLCAFFFLMSTLSYLKYTLSSLGKGACLSGRQGNRRINYILCLLFFILALMSKPMAVTLPVVFIILDLYPLERLSLKTYRSVLIEKLPFFILSIASSVITVMAQQTGGAVSSLEVHPFGERLLVAFRALFFYIYKILWPMDLAPLYPYPSDVFLFRFEYIGAIMLILGITAFCIYTWKKQKFLSAIWAYYLVTLLPVLGIIQVGKQSMADRYTYLPGLGPMLFIGVGILWLWKKANARHNGPILRLTHLIIIISVLFFGFLTNTTLKQISVWKDPLTFWNAEIERFPDGPSVIYLNRGNVYKHSGLHELAINDYNTAISLDPGFAITYFNRGIVYGELKKYEQAINDYSTAINLDPYYAYAYSNRGLVYEELGNYQKSLQNYNKALKLDPSDMITYYNRGILYTKIGLIPDADKDFQTAARSGNKEAQNYLISKGIRW